MANKNPPLAKPDEERVEHRVQSDSTFLEREEKVKKPKPIIKSKKDIKRFIEALDPGDLAHMYGIDDRGKSEDERDAEIWAYRKNINEITRKDRKLYNV